METENMRDLLFHKMKNGYDHVGGTVAAEAHAYCDAYKLFLDRAKTEREAVTAAEVMAKAKGYRPFTPGSGAAPGDRLYVVNRGKAIAVAYIGRQPLDNGVWITASHIDAPRIDLKASPLYEDGELALFKTHYYGGIRKYQWVTVPLALHGVVVLKDGSVKQIAMGEREDEPVLCITDLLPHLAKDQNTKTLQNAFTGENLNALVGSMPYQDEGSDRVKFAVLSILYEMYGITEADLLSAELSLVPAGTSRDVGLDRSMVGGYGQDDRVCAYTTLTALLDRTETPEHTCLCLLTDKEEIGSEGVSGAQSDWYETLLRDLCSETGASYDRCCMQSFCLSADVNAAFDPNFPEVFDKQNSTRVNYGAAIMKYTGARGKSEASDASAELVARVRAMLDGAGVIWQMGTLGKVDQGGGGTVAKFFANRNIDTIDIGVPILSMHAPFELASKLDIYMMYKAAAALYALEK